MDSRDYVIVNKNPVVKVKVGDLVKHCKYGETEIVQVSGLIKNLTLIESYDYVFYPNEIISVYKPNKDRTEYKEIWKK